MKTNHKTWVSSSTILVLFLGAAQSGFAENKKSAVDPITQEFVVIASDASFKSEDTVVYQQNSDVLAIVKVEKKSNIECSIGSNNGTVEGSTISFSPKYSEKVVCKNNGSDPKAMRDTISVTYFAKGAKKLKWSDIGTATDGEKVETTLATIESTHFDNSAARAYVREINLVKDQTFTVSPPNRNDKSLTGMIKLATLVKGDAVEFTAPSGKIGSATALGPNSASSKSFSLPEGQGKKLKKDGSVIPNTKLPFPEEAPFALVCGLHLPGNPDKLLFVADASNEAVTFRSLESGGDLYCRINQKEGNYQSVAPGSGAVMDQGQYSIVARIYNEAATIAALKKTKAENLKTKEKMETEIQVARYQTLSEQVNAALKQNQALDDRYKVETETRQRTSDLAAKYDAAAAAKISQAQEEANEQIRQANDRMTKANQRASELKVNLAASGETFIPNTMKRRYYKMYYRFGLKPTSTTVMFEDGPATKVAYEIVNRQYAWIPTDVLPPGLSSGDATQNRLTLGDLFKNAQAYEALRKNIVIQPENIFFSTSPEGVKKPVNVISSRTDLGQEYKNKGYTDVVVCMDPKMEKIQGMAKLIGDELLHYPQDMDSMWGIIAGRQGFASQAAAADCVINEKAKTFTMVRDESSDIEYQYVKSSEVRQDAKSGTNELFVTYLPAAIVVNYKIDELGITIPYTFYANQQPQHPFFRTSYKTSYRADKRVVNDKLGFNFCVTSDSTMPEFDEHGSILGGKEVKCKVPAQQ